MNVIRRILVSGRVQSVGFRAFVEHEALKRGLEGWVRNCRDGTVEAVFSGDAAVVADMIDACRRGPQMSHVDSLDQRDGTAAELAKRAPGERFSVLST
jgi:acylphosphatase